MGKRCYKCKTEKALEDFHKNRSRKDGLAEECKACKKVRNAQRDLEYMREYMREYDRKRWEDPEYREAKRKSNRNRRSSWSEEERIADGSVRKAVARRGARTTKEFYGGHTFSEAVAFTIPFAEERLRLEEETGVPHHIDHIKPLCEGGLHVPENLQVLTEADNWAKGPVWLEEDLTDEEIERMDREILEFTP